ncbi:4-hydroxy-2-oxovalerate aldolase [Miniphocaeibacter halophilus]|uniref:4-hydroxy-2-oxovalerate aldolase n=1 Tax=Miniphocaeibacter halophilus TaxID=2931922 RepID=A0AC61MPV9_9FIRM|nr:4-hydroxy-2-oxovalerate aldolase [Miniphocaeibacter halophilus]QQK07600.1 4-hydroxy-2-oxovalerate aldolase [Miniphocaeibacter halophilus]
MPKVFVTDTTLRDGSHSVGHKFDLDDIKEICKGLDEAKVDIIEVGHGDGLTGSTCNYGFSKYDDFEMLEAASSVIKNSKLATLLLPGIGTVEDLKKAKECGVEVVRIATHVTEADISQQHITEAKKMGFFVVGFLMMAHRANVDKVLEEAKKMESYGADVVYATDSAGAMLPNDVRNKIGTLVKELKIPIGFHSHDNLGLAIGNSIAAIEAGATYLDGSLGGLGAGAGNTPTEMLVAVLNRLKIEHNVDMFKTMDVSSKKLIPIVKKYGVNLNNLEDSMMLGYSGVYSSFMLHAKRAAARFNVDYRDIILELGRREAVGGQEDWIVEIAEQLENK